MKRDELLQRLQRIKDRGNQALSILEAIPQTAGTEAEARSIAIWLKNELQEEFLRTSPERIQKAMTIFEISIYAPTIEEAWKQSGISRLKTDDPPSSKWTEALEAVVYTACRYI
ncbi:MAG TPA: hypothetical protein VGB94_08025 [Acidobacteriaceae bacterium]